MDNNCCLLLLSQLIYYCSHYSFILSCDGEKDCKSSRISELVRSMAVARGQVDLTT